MPVHRPQPLPIARHLVRLRLTDPARFHFLHGGVLRGLLSRALGEHELPEGVVPAAVESGRVGFEAGEAYHFGLTLVGDERRRAGALARGLERVGAAAVDAGAPPTLGGNFRVESVEELAAPDVAAEAAVLGDLVGVGRPLTLQLLSPLRLQRPPGLEARGAAYLNADCFPPEHFLGRLAARVRRLGPPAAGGTAEASSPPLPDGLGADARELLWIDLPVPGAPGKRRPYTLGGVVGRVRLEGVPAEWLPWIVLARHLHVGASTGYGFGRFRIVELEEAFPEPFWPSQSVLARAITAERLGEALDHVTASSEAAGEDGVEPEAFARGAGRRLGDLARELIAGRYRPTALAGVLLRKEDGGVRPLAIPTVRDRVAQRAVAQVLAEAVDTLLEDCSYAYRKGFSRAGAARALEVAYAEGYRFVLDADVEAFFDSVDHRRLSAKLHALWPLDPVLPVIEGWLAAPVVFDGRPIDRDRGLPQGGAISPLLANLYLDEFDEEVLGAGYRLVRYADDFVVLAKDLDEARRAREVVRQELAALGLRLHAEKTAIRSFDDGFGFLGYLFVRSATPAPPCRWSSRSPARACRASSATARARSTPTSARGSRAGACGWSRRRPQPTVRCGCASPARWWPPASPTRPSSPCASAGDGTTSWRASCASWPSRPRARRAWSRSSASKAAARPSTSPPSPTRSPPSGASPAAGASRRPTRSTPCSPSRRRSSTTTPRRR